MSRYRPQYVVLAAILAAQALLAVLFPLMDDPVAALAMLGGGISSALMLVEDARTPRARRSCADGARPSRSRRRGPARWGVFLRNTLRR